MQYKIDKQHCESNISHAYIYNIESRCLVLKLVCNFYTEIKILGVYKQISAPLR